jgi:hypothetical protein
MQTGQPLRRLSPEAIRLTEAQMVSDADSADLHFAALKRLLDRDGSDYAI